MIPAQEVRDATAEVLRDPAYADLQPGPGDRIVAAARDLLAQVLDAVLGSVGAGAVAQGLVLLALVLLAAVAVLAARRLRGGPAAPVVVPREDGLDLPTLVARADAAADAGDHAGAVRSRYAALVLALELRGVLEQRPGTTVGEVDEAVRTGLPAATGLVGPAGVVLAEVVYGAGAAGPEEDRTVARALDAVHVRRVVGS